MKVLREEYTNFPDKCQTVVNAVEGQALEDTEVFDKREEDTEKEINKNIKLPFDGAPKASKPKQAIVPEPLKESLDEDINEHNASRIVQETIAHDFGLEIQTASYKDAEDAKCVIVEFIASKADCKKMPYDELKDSLYKRFGDDVNISCKQFSSPNLKNKGTEYKLKLFIIKEKKDKSKIYAEGLEDAFTKQFDSKGQEINEDLIAQPVVNIEPSSDCVKSAAEAVMTSYQNANKWFDIIKEYLYTIESCVFFSSYIHNLAHSMPVRFDKFGDILHTINMKIPYPATDYIPQDPKSLDEVFNLVFMILDDIKAKLNDFIKCTDESNHGMSCAAEELLNDIEEEYVPLYRMQKAWSTYNGDAVRFDKWVGQYTKEKDNLIENLKGNKNMKVIKESLNTKLTEGIYTDTNAYSSSIWGSDPLTAGEYSGASYGTGASAENGYSYKDFDLPEPEQPVVNTLLSQEIADAATAATGSDITVSKGEKVADVKAKAEILANYLKATYNIDVYPKTGMDWSINDQAWKLTVFGTEDDLNKFLAANGTDDQVRKTLSSTQWDELDAGDKSDEDAELTLIDLLDIELDADQGWSGNLQYRRIPTKDGSDDFAYTRYGLRDIVPNNERYNSEEIAYTADGNIKIRAEETGRGGVKHTIDFAKKVADAYKDYGVTAKVLDEKRGIVLITIPDEYKEKPIWDEELARKEKLFADGFNAYKAAKADEKAAKKAAKAAKKVSATEI